MGETARDKQNLGIITIKCKKYFFKNQGESICFKKQICKLQMDKLSKIVPLSNPAEQTRKFAWDMSGTSHGTRPGRTWNNKALRLVFQFKKKNDLNFKMLFFFMKEHYKHDLLCPPNNGINEWNITGNARGTWNTPTIRSVISFFGKIAKCDPNF